MNKKPCSLWPSLRQQHPINERERDRLELFFIRIMKKMPSSFRWCGAVALCLSLLICRPARAQNVIASPPQTPATPAAVQDYQNSSPMQVFAPAAAAPPLPLQWGPVTLHPHVDYQFSYADGLQSSAGQHEDSVIQQVSPGILFNVGDHWTLDFTPTLFFYSSSSFQNTVNQSVSLGWGTSYGDWFFSGSQSYVSTSDPNITTAAQTDEEIYRTTINANYQMNDKMSLDMGVNQTFTYVGNGSTPTNYLQSYSSFKSWSTTEWLNYQFWPRFNAGLGLGGGYNTQEGSPDSIYEQYQGRVNWRATDKVSFQLSGGVQTLQYLSGGGSPLVSPLYAATIQYLPFQQTRLSVDGSGAVSPSSFQNQTVETYRIMGNLDQRLLGWLYLNLSGGYTTTKYEASASGLSTSRDDNVYSFNVRLTCHPLNRATLSAFYQYSDNSSSQSGFTTGSGFGYTSNQVGFEIAYQH